MFTTLQWMVLLSLLLSACAPPKPAPEPPTNTVKPNTVKPVAERQAEVQSIQSFDLNGAIAVRNPEKSWTASINWRQQGANSYQIRLFGPLGSGTILISKQGNKVVLQDGPKRASSHSAAKLLAQETGVSLPVHHLFYWVRALPAPGGGAKISRDRYNHISHLRQGGYSVQYLQYTATPKGDLPSSIRLEGQGIKVKLIIKRWKV
ncbi:MAG: outer membrane lipoprotein LolB [Legionellaceae bacterium]|nr:outer membrane lipoprotein LolB [Legionellaceae bacterium]